MEPKPKPRSSRFLNVSLKIVLILAIFSLGVNVGSGQIGLSRNQPVSKNLPDDLNYESVDKIYESLKENYDGKLTATQLEEGLKHGLAEATNDPYTTYFTPKEAKEFKDQLNNSFSGIGAQLGEDDTGNLEVIAPIDGFPAEKAGLKAKDIIVNINKQSTADMSVDEAVSKIRGAAGSKVTLQVVRNKSESLDFTITRQDINLPSVEQKILDSNIGYLKISSFAYDTVELSQKAAQDFKSKNVKAVILDMRNNPGGLLDASIKLSSFWLPAGQTVLDEKRGKTLVSSEKAEGGDDYLKGIPTVVLINEGSASASEIVAGALKDNKAAYLIGEKTYGKGVVQQLINLRDDSQLKVTVASWYRPNGQNINKKGITPDKTIKISDADAKAAKDTQLEAAQSYLNKP